MLCANVGWLVESSKVMVRLASPTMQVLVCKIQIKYKTVEADLKLMMIHYEQRYTHTHKNGHTNGIHSMSSFKCTQLSRHLLQLQ